MIVAASPAPIVGDEYASLLRAGQQNDPANRITLGGLLAEIFEQVPTAELLEHLHTEDVPCGRIHALGEVHLDEQIVHNQAVVEWDHPAGGQLRQPRPGARFSVSPVEPSYTVPTRCE